MSDLEWWISRIEDWARGRGLDFYPQEFILSSEDQMLEHLAYHGGYPLYRHWKFGKSFFVNRELFRRQFFFLPYEVVINTNPSRAHLLETNPLIKNIVTIGHVYAHSDFFKNNRAYKKTDAATVDSRFRKYAEIVEKHGKNPRIGLAAVENAIEAAHSVMFLQTDEGTLLEYILKKADWLPDWKKEVLKAVQETAKHLVAGAQTKIMNEGWATYWHYQMLEDLKGEIKSRLNRRSYDANLRDHQFHLRVIDMPDNPRSINPYRVGFYTWGKIAQDRGEKFIFEVRANKTDFGFLLDYFCGQHDLIYREFVRPGFVDPEIKKDPTKTPNDIMPIEKREWNCQKYQEAALNTARDSSRPYFKVFVEEVSKKDGKKFMNLLLNHQFQNQYLKRGYIEGALKLIYRLWQNPVILTTKLGKKETKDNVESEIACDVIFTCFTERQVMIDWK